MGLVHAKIETSIETSPQLIESLHMAREIALKSNAAEVLPIHLSLAMLDDDESSFLLEAYGVKFDKVRVQLNRLARTHAQPKTSDSHAVFSQAIETLMRHAREQAQKNALGEVDGNLILAIFLSQTEGFLAKLLKPYDLDTSGVLQYLELREGKTVDLDPLPTSTKPGPRAAPKAAGPGPNTQPPSNPDPLPTSQAGLGNPAFVNPPPPSALQQADPRAAQTRPVSPTENLQFPPSARPNPTEQQAPPPMPLPVTRPVENQNDVPNRPPNQAANIAQFSGFSLPQAAPVSPAPAPNAPMARTPPAQDASPIAPPEQIIPPTTAPSAPEAAPSRFRSMVSGFGKAFKGKGDKPASPANEAPAQPLATPPQQAPAKKPVTHSVDNLVNQPVPAPQHNEGDGPSFAQIAQHNRPAKRRRAIPASLGARESLSATGSCLEKGRLVENIPRRMKVNKPSKAEVRITRAQMEEITSEFDDLSDSHIHELAVTEAMTVQLRAPGGGFHIENLSPQTQWIDRNQRHVHDADFGVWRWNVTPTKSGKARLQLVISARTVDDEGTIHIADIPDKIIELGVNRDHAQILKRAGILAIVALTGLSLGRFGESTYQWLQIIASKIG